MQTRRSSINSSTQPQRQNAQPKRRRTQADALTEVAAVPPNPKVKRAALLTATSRLLNTPQEQPTPTKQLPRPPPSTPALVSEIQSENDQGGLDSAGEGDDLRRTLLRASVHSVELKRLLQGDADPAGVSLVGREAELDSLEQFLRGNANHSVLYVCGPPGSGKTAAVRAVVRKLQDEANADRRHCGNNRCRYLMHNCMETGNSTRDFAARLALLIEEAAGGPAAAPPAGEGGGGQLKAAEAAVRRALAAGFSLALVLDEIDQVDAASLRRVFRWPDTLTGGDAGGGRLRLLGVANSLALCDHMFPAGHRPPGLRQQGFAPYTRTQLLEIVAARLGPQAAAEAADAVRLAAGRVAASTGDARRVLEVCRRSVELADGSPSLRHVGEALRSAASSPAASVALPLHQRLTAAAVLQLRRRGLRQVTLAELDAALRALCDARQMPAPPAEELSACCQSLHDMGVLRFAPAAEVRASRAALRLDDRAVEALIQDPVLLAAAALR